MTWYIRQATPSDAAQVADVIITAFPSDKELWNYRFPYRDQYPDDHRKWLTMLVQQWLAPENTDYTVMVIDAPILGAEPQAETVHIAAFAVWNISYLNRRKHGPEYVEFDPHRALLEAGSADRRDANPLWTAAFAANSSRVKQALERFGPEQLVIQALGTRVDFHRKGLGSALVRWGMEKAAQDGVALTVSATSMGSRLYASHCFEYVGPEVVSQVPGEEEKAVTYTMAYDPRKK